MKYQLFRIYLARIAFGLILLFPSEYVFSQEIVSLYDGAIPHNKPDIKIQEQVTNRTMANGRPASFIRKISIPQLFIYQVPTSVKNSGKAVIICPGGGYGGLAIDHEGHEVARKLADNGITGIVLKYRCPDEEIVLNKMIVPLYDVHRAIQLTRMNAKKWKISKNKIGIMGSSAGGHLASTAATHFEISDLPDASNINLRPDFAILNYPVISFADSITHEGSKNNLIRTESGILQKNVLYYSNELKVNHQTPPVFITHAVDDKVVLIANSILFTAACLQYGVPVQSFYYSTGGHGFGIVNPQAKVQWIDSCILWVKSLK